VPHSQQEVETIKTAPAVPGVMDVVLHRWSPRAFADKPVADADLRSLFEAARWAASSSNEQPWRFLAGRRGDETYRRIFDSLVEFNQKWARSAPVLILSVARKTYERNGDANYHALHDTGAASAQLALQATALGLHVHSMGGFDHAKARQLFGIPEEFDMGAAIAVGYLGDPEQLEGSMKDRELAPRERKPLEQIVFGMWGEPARL
jgi:nitroreductase